MKYVKRLNKRLFLVVLLVLTLALTPTSALAAGPGSWTVDIGNPTSETQSGITVAGWGPI